MSIPLILRADADLASLHLTIWGVNLGTVTPVVKLAGTPLTVLTYSTTGIVAAITMFLAREPLIDLAGKLVEGVSVKRKTRKRRKATEDAKDHKIAALEDKLRRKHEVLSELMEEHVQLKKATTR